MTLFQVVLLAIATLAGPALPDETVERYAADIIAVAGNDAELAIALVATADEEGLHFNPRIERCECKGNECDRDKKTGVYRAVSLYQLHVGWWAGHARTEICESNRLATELAANALVSMRKAHRGSIRIALRLFNGAPADDPRIVRRWRVFDRWMAQARMAA